MSVFSRIFRKVAPLPTIEERIADLQAATAEQLRGAALGGDEQMRVAAVHQLPDGDALRRLAGVSGLDKGAGGADPGAGTGVPAAVERAARARLAQLIDADAVDFAALCRNVDGRPALFAVAASCKDPRRLPQALAAIDDMSQVAQLVVESPLSRVRQVAAERIAAAGVEDPELLKQLLRQIRGKDKTVYKILKQKCDALNAEHRQAAEHAAAIDALCASLERHAERSYDSSYVSVFEHLTARWRSLAPVPADIERLALKAIDRCKEVIEAQRRWVEQQASQRAAEDAARRVTLEIEEVTRRAAVEAASAQAEADDEERAAAASRVEAEAALRAAAAAAEEQTVRQIGGLIRQAREALGSGNTQRAAGLRRAVAQKLPALAKDGLGLPAPVPGGVALPAPLLPPYLGRQLQQLDDELNNLRQWKDYAVAPKRIELMEAMETLVGSREEPTVLAEQIKWLQQEWRTLSKGIVSETPAEWERFHQASQTAYEPCRDYFAAQAKVRQENLAGRKGVLERLTAFEARDTGEPAQYHLLACVLREAPQEWRRYFPVDRDANRAVQLDFDASIARLRARLAAWHEVNAADKRALIQRARHALSLEDGRDAIDAVKRLQLLWKEAGPAARDAEQSLWTEFRELCDAVFQKRQQAHAEFSAALEANKAAAVALCVEAERVAALSGTPLLDGVARIPEWQGAFDALAELPRPDARGLKIRFERAVDACRAHLAQQRAREAERAVSHLFEAVGHLRAYEWAVTRDASAAEREALKRAADTYIASVPQWPKGALQAVKDTLARAGASADAGRDSREQALKLLCIRAEIHGDMPTAPDDEASRREYQVQRLMQGIGQGNRREEWHELMLEWIRIGAVSPALYDNLQARFLRARASGPD